MKLKRVENRIQIGIYRKESHTLKYSTYNSNRPRNEQLGILKNMLFRAYNLCDPVPDREQEIQTLRYAFINQDYPPKDVEQTISNYQECEGMKKTNRQKIEVNRLLFHISEAFQRNYAEIWQSRMLMLYSKRERRYIQ